MNYRPNPDFPNRYILPKKLFSYLQDNYSDYISEIGRSSLDVPIYLFSLGNGPVRILAWSQMHGNESAATHALLDLLEFFKHDPAAQNALFSRVTLHFIPMLNPDGAEKWQRRNALDIDMNRDFLKLSSRELPLLRQLAAVGNYRYALNLHEQRTIFSTNGTHPATLAFLAPSQDPERTLTPNRKKAMAVIAKLFEKLKGDLPNQIARYTDEFYPTSVGDNLMKAGLPCILFEGGHFQNDYLRKNTRKFYSIAFYEALQIMADLDGSTENWDKYREIPENRETHYDIIYRNVKLNTPFPCVLDIAVQYREVLSAGAEEISFVPIVVEVGDVSRKKGWSEIDCTGKKFISKTKYPVLDAEADFRIE